MERVGTGIFLSVFNPRCSHGHTHPRFILPPILNSLSPLKKTSLQLVLSTSKNNPLFPAWIAHRLLLQARAEHMAAWEACARAIFLAFVSAGIDLQEFTILLSFSCCLLPSTNPKITFLSPFWYERMCDATVQPPRSQSGARVV